MKEFFNNVDYLPEGIQKLRGEERIFIYGIGEYARKVKGILDRFNIKIEGYLVSEEYYRITGGGYIYDEIISRIESIVVVAGFNILVHRDLTDKLIFDTHVKRIYVVDGNSKYMWKYNYYFDLGCFIHPKIYLIDDFYDGIVKDRKWNYDFYINNKEAFHETYQMLEDDKSKITMEKCLEGWLELKNFSLMDLWKRADYDNQYFPDIIRFGQKEVVIDCGAYKGDTLAKFDSRVTEYYKYYALEPDKRCFDSLKKQIVHCNNGEIIHIPYGAWSKREIISFSTKDCGTIVAMDDINVEKENCKNIEVDAIDNIIPDDEMVTFIKMDIEGAELEALKGSVKTIRRCGPKLAICVYHKREDLIMIPQYIKAVSDKYRFYLRGHLYCPSEVVLYAVQE